MNLDDIVHLLTVATLIIGIIIYKIVEFRTHEYRCPYCRYKVPMNISKLPYNIVWCGRPRIKCPKCNETSFFEIREKSKY